MSDGPTPVETLPGTPPSWPATLRDLLRDAADGGADRAALSSELADGPAAEEGAAERRLAFLERTAVVDCGEDGCVPGEHGREYLDTHDETVLYGALASAVDGFDPALEALAVRPLTDVEIADLLSATLDADADAETARAYGDWLRALGYLSREDGVNELTRTGRRLVATTGGAGPRAATPEMGTARGADDRRFRAGVDAAPPPGADSDAEDDGGDARDESLERDLRARYDDTCMVCGDRRQRGPDEGHSAVHYLMPLEDPHDGPAAPENAVVVCPNHRADLEHGTLTVDPRTRTVEHEYEPEVSGRTLLTADDHEVGAQYLAYHNDVVASG